MIQFKVVDATGSQPGIQIGEAGLLAVAELVGIDPAVDYRLKVVFKHPNPEKPVYGYSVNRGPSGGLVVVYVLPKPMTPGSNRVVSNTLVHEMRHIKQYLDAMSGKPAMSLSAMEKDAWAFAREHVSQGSFRCFDAQEAAA